MNRTRVVEYAHNHVFEVICSV